jgi:hypothetical protein
VFFKLWFRIAYLKVAPSESTRQLKSMKSSVRVPVLSKHKQFVKPPWITLFGELQNIFFYFNFYRAKIIPKVILTGNPGGTVIVIRSKNFMNKVCEST